MDVEQEIRDLLTTYERAVNTSDAMLAAACYTRDGMLMPALSPTAAGAALRDAYIQMFAALRLHLAFTIDELVVASDTVAYALTHSNGTQTMVATGAESVEGNREVFVFGREDGAWKIRRYLFNTLQ